MVITRSAPPAMTLWTGAAAASMAVVPRRTRVRAPSAPGISASPPTAISTGKLAGAPPPGTFAPGHKAAL